MIVGGSAAKNNFTAFKDVSGNFELKIEKPAGFGAFANIESPPPEIAPETKAHFEISDKVGT